MARVSFLRYLTDAKKEEGQLDEVSDEFGREVVVNSCRDGPTHSWSLGRGQSDRS
jgi:hypothetical protein